jgi:hypothetical protein
MTKNAFNDECHYHHASKRVCEMGSRGCVREHIAERLEAEMSCAPVAQMTPRAEDLESSGPRASGRAGAPILTETLPGVLVSFAYASNWAKICHLTHWREVMLDSGAFTVHKTGGAIDLVEFAEWAKAEVIRDARVVEVITLDVIGGSWRESLANTEALWKLGVEVIPVFHVGEPTDVLKALARDYPKVALGGAVGYRKRMEWAKLCFKHVWPKRLHGLGFGEQSLSELPFHSIDNSSWDFAPRQYGNYHSMKTQLPTRSSSQLNLRGEIDFYLAEEARGRRFWKGRMPADFGTAPSIRLALTAAASQLKSFLPPGVNP